MNDRFEHSLWPAFRVRSLSSAAHESGVELSRDLHKVFRAIEQNLRSPVAGDACEALLFLAPLIEACYDAQVLASNDASLINASSSSSTASTTTTNTIATNGGMSALNASTGAIEPPSSATSTSTSMSTTKSNLNASVRNAASAALDADASKRRRLVRDERGSNANVMLQNQHRITVDYCYLLVAELFRNGSNVNRHLLLHVFNVCERFLAFVVSADEVVNRVVSVVASNDPIAQSLSLDALACLRLLIAPRADVRHRMLACVAASDRTVRAAALRAVERLADSATRFGDEAAPVLVALLADATVDAASRTHAAHILRHMHRCDVRVIDTVRRALRLALEETNDDGLRATALVSLAMLASRTLIDVPGQMQRSLDIALSDASDAPLWRTASRCARRLAARAPALLERDACDSIAKSLLAASQSQRRSSVSLGALRSMLLSSVPSLWVSSTVDAAVAACQQRLRESNSLVCCANSAAILWHVARDRVDGDLAVQCVRAVARCPLPTAPRRGGAALVALLRIVANAPAATAPAALTQLLSVVAANLDGSLARVRLLLRAAAYLACVHPEVSLQHCGKQWIALLRSAGSAAVCDAVLDSLCATVRRLDVAANASWQSELCSFVDSSGLDAHALYCASRVAGRHALHSVATSCIARVQASAAAAALPHTHAPWLAVVAGVLGAGVTLFAAAQASCGARERSDQAIADAALGNALRESQRAYDSALLAVEQLAVSSPLAHNWSFQQQWLTLRARNSGLLGAVVASMAVSDSPRALGCMLARRFGGPLAEAAAEIEQLATAVRSHATTRSTRCFGAIPSDDASALRAYATAFRLLSQLCAAASADDASNRARLRAIAIVMAAEVATPSIARTTSDAIAAWPHVAPLRGQLLCSRLLTALGSDDVPLSSAALIRDFLVALLGATPLATPALFFRTDSH
jgi:hypothetical protein